MPHKNSNPDESCGCIGVAGPMAKTMNELILLDAILSSPCEHSKFNRSGYFKIFKPIENKDLRSIRVGVDFDWAKLSDPGIRDPVRSIRLKK